MTYEFFRFEQLDLDTLYELLALRFEVFVIGQGNIYRDLDGFDQKAVHLLARDEGGRLVGYVRVLPAELCYNGRRKNSFGRLAVLDDCRGRGTGGELVRRACGWLAENTPDKEVEIAAMAYLERFYSRLGFERVSQEYLISGVPHVDMVRRG